LSTALERRFIYKEVFVQMPWWVMLFSILVMPLLQPITDYGANKLQVMLGLKQQQQPVSNPAQQPQPYIVYHNGQWWKFENNQWYVWSPNQ
jgi:hypothetical protein